MNPTTLVSLITAAATLITAIGGFVVVLKELRKNTAATNGVHTLVNQQHTDAMAYQQALRKALTNAGIVVPPDASLPPEGPPK